MRWKWGFGVLIAFTAVAAADPSAESGDDDATWLAVVRQTPFWESQGVAENLATIRTWVLLSQSYCQEPQRHLLFDHRGQFLSYIDNGASPSETIERLNQTRKQLAEKGRASYWHPGADDRRGYPLALACHQPFVDIQEATARLLGKGEDYRVWGTWDGISVGTKNDRVSLVELFRVVYEHRREQGRFTFPDSVMSSFLGKTIIESGAQKNALSSKAARGIMQLRPEVLDDCEIPQAFRLHRMAQVDCALRLVEQNHRNLREPFEATFGDLPDAKRERLYGLLLTQAYQIGVGRTVQLLTDDELGRAARYFAEHHTRFSAEDIQVGMIYHNVGREDIGLRTLYYVTDIRLAQQALCATEGMTDHAWCAD
ncbi:hypothetical protein OOT55_11205 [Marinimicrobium sp. C6131]|uniref:hypothetical protein n=1 Tax=Marinimicrobium sp. C6131 TaxID=3022676 RepID=UPI00223E49C2|nr:hypothetical protein [Marinimicrobium sp. C6131]UZJ43217.1 hypothetical protein OOT55_11205 [Marinimicrobium sp. C6131]